MLRRNPTSRQDRPEGNHTERRPSQCARVYAVLRRWYPQESPLWAMHDLKPRISDLTTRIWELRHRYGLVIENRTERQDGEVCSFYLLARDSREAATAFGYMGMIEGVMALQFGRKHKRELLSYLALGFFSLGCGLYLAISESASIQTVSLVAAPHAILFGLGELRIGHHLERHRAYRRGLFLGGVVEILLGVALIVGYRLSTEDAVMLLGYVATISVLQLLPLVFYWHKSYANKQTR